MSTVSARQAVGPSDSLIGRECRAAAAPVEADELGLPPSGLAASTMPFDSMPISFAGFRLATMTIVRPTSASGS